MAVEPEPSSTRLMGSFGWTRQGSIAPVLRLALTIRITTKKTSTVTEAITMMTIIVAIEIRRNTKNKNNNDSYHSRSRK